MSPIFLPLIICSKWSFFSGTFSHFSSMNPPCAQCGTKNVWKIRLRGAEIEEDGAIDGSDDACRHVVCVYCMLMHLYKWIRKDRARIKCPSEHCNKRVHENDIHALLDPENTDLDRFLARRIRKQLLHRFEFNAISYAFWEGGTRICPRCKNLYAKKIGCNYVRCPNLRCNTWFCWECGEKDINWAHFINGRCMVKWDDVLKGLYFVTFLLFAGGITLFYISWPIELGLFVFSPLVVTFSTPILLLNWIKRQWIVKDALSKFNRKYFLIYWTLYSLLYVLLLPFGSIIGALSLLVSLLLFFLLWVLLLVKLIPIIGQIVVILEILQYITGCFGYGEWLQWYKKSKEEKEMERLADRQFRRERGERMANPRVGR